MNKNLVYGLTCVLMMLAGATAHATTIVLPADEQLIAKSPVILEGTVVSTTPVDRNGAIWTETAIEVSRNIKGRTEQTITVHEIGGVLDGRATKIYGTAEFKSGERVLLFLDETQYGLRTVDMFVGKLTEAKMGNGRRLWLRNDFEQDATLLDAELRPLASKNVQRDAERFETFVTERVAGRPGTKNYGVQNPVLARQQSTGERGGVTSDFTLIDEPTVYRWFRFASGQATAWVSSGTQPGYSNGGVSELQTAMASWNNYTAAKIIYTYNGTRSGSLGGLNAPNGANEVLFNDPLGEITGSWNKSTGGVVGIGGFNAIANSPLTWDAPFTADEDHPAGAVTAWNITEGNLTIQDNVSPANGIPSSRLAEIVAHEFGHTLGFGHSSDQGALMYFSVTGAGPSLRADDKLAARWLYPSGDGGGEPGGSAPAAPTNLAVTGVSGSNANISWQDNSSNEDGFTIFTDGQSIGNVGANTTSAQITGFSSGQHSIHVVAYNGSGSSAASNTVNVSINQPAVASFTVAPEAGNVGTPFQFRSTSTGSIASLSWDFGDGGTAGNVSEPAHTYISPRQYTVTLSVRGTNGNLSTATKLINVSGPLVASYVYTPANPRVNESIAFADQSSGAPTAWLWTFGDGTSSVDQNPSKHYAVAGDYPVSLTIYRNNESATGTRVVTVSSGVPATPTVVAAFDMSTSNAAAGASVVFTDRSAGSPTAWVWSFGDGGTSSLQNPVHAYAAPGTYLVTLTASNASTTGITTKNISVTTIAAYRTLVSVAAQTPGAGNTSWRTELNVFNAGSQAASIVLAYIPSGGGNAITRSLVLGPNQSKTYANSLLDLFDIPSGAGALTLDATSAGGSADLRVTSRTFTTGPDGTYGQAVPDVRPDELQQTLYVTGITANDAYRTNIGLVNRESAPVNATLTLYNAIGNTLATRNVTLAAGSFQQSGLAAYFPVVEGGSYDVLTMKIVAASPSAVSGYASVVNNRTQDPIYIQAVPSSPANTMVVPVVGRAPGANGTFWRSDVTLFNPSAANLTVSLRYNNATQQLLLGGTDTVVLADVLSRFGQTAGAGTLQMSWTGSAPVVTSRTYTSVESGGTYGQSIDPVAAFAPRMFVPGLRHDDEFRTNIGVLNGGNETENITVTLLSPFGTELGRTTITLTPGLQVQYGVTALFPNAAVGGGFTLHAEGDANAQLFAYGSMVDNKSGDPVFFAGR
ncbi:MAG TPA: PKD domain-containing protein [Thermoanaerobaculia bacterium]|nr:PKD domain-containing protein [Thermoanaerobaculia bacterium]